MANSARRTERLLSPGLRERLAAEPGGFRDLLGAFFEAADAQEVPLPALQTRCYLVKLADGSRLHVYEERLTAENFACDCCRIVGRQRPGGRGGAGQGFRTLMRPAQGPRRCPPCRDRACASIGSCRDTREQQRRCQESAPPLPSPSARSLVDDRRSTFSRSLSAFPPSPAGWQGHPVGRLNWHFIVPAEVRLAGRRLVASALRLKEALSLPRAAASTERSLPASLPSSPACSRRRGPTRWPTPPRCAPSPRRGGGARRGRPASPCPSQTPRRRTTTRHRRSLSPRCTACTVRVTREGASSELALSCCCWRPLLLLALCTAGQASPPLPCRPASTPCCSLLAGTVHSNGFGHLARLNGREGGSKRASGRQLMQARLCCVAAATSSTQQQRGCGASVARLEPASR